MENSIRRDYLLRQARKNQAYIQQCIESIRELKSRMEQSKYRLILIDQELSAISILQNETNGKVLKVQGD